MPIVPRIDPGPKQMFDRQYMDQTDAQVINPHSSKAEIAEYDPDEIVSQHFEKPSPMALILTAAQMAEEGKFNQVAATQYDWNSLGKKQQDSLIDEAHSPKTEGEYNKFDEFLYEKGTIRLPAGDGDKDPMKYLDAPHNNLPKDVERYNLPDGSVILKLRKDKDVIS